MPDFKSVYNLMLMSTVVAVNSAPNATKQVPSKSRRWNVAGMCTEWGVQAGQGSLEWPSHCSPLLTHSSEHS